MKTNRHETPEPFARHVIDTFSGTPREIGQAWGRRYAQFIQALYYEGNAYHVPHPIERELGALTHAAREKLQTHCPEYLEEIEAASEACGLSTDQMLRRVDGFMYQRGAMRQAAPAAHGCFQIACMSRNGPVVGSIMDSPRICFMWWRIQPARGYAHLALTIPGTAVSDRGINEKGLVVSESSTPNRGADYEQDLLLHPLATRKVLETCATVDEAIDCMTALPVSHAYIFADAGGNLKGLQTTPAGHAVYSPDTDGVIVLANHIRDAALHGKMIARGYNPEYRNANSELRVQTAHELARDHVGEKDVDFIRSVLGSHRGYPDSICRDGNAATFVGAPQQDPKHIWIAERFPCAAPFLRYGVRAEDDGSNIS